MISEETVSQIVRQTVDEFLKANAFIKEKNKRKIFILNISERSTSTTTTLVDEILDTYDLVIGYSNLQQPQKKETSLNAIKQVDLSTCSRSEWCSILKEIDLVVVPVLSMGTLVKISHLIDDEPGSAIIIDALLMGKLVMASRNHIGSSGINRLTAPPEILKKISIHLQTITQYGIQLTSFKNLSKMISRLLSSRLNQQRPLVHANHILDWIDEGRTHISIPTNSLITPLAKDKAKELGLNLNSGLNGKEEYK